MKRLTLNPLHTWGTAARYGAALGFISALVYGGLATLYIILRSSLQILDVLSPAEGLLGTLLANAFGVLWPCLVTTLLLGVLAAVIETAAFSIIYGLSLALNGRRSPGRAAAIGLLVAGGLAALVNILVVRGIGAYWDAFWPQGYVFWLGLPSLLFIGTTAWLCWQGEARRAGPREELPRTVARGSQ
jgi:predicted outer membrane lipoprotein